MLTTLLESRPHHARSTHFAVASATVHAILIFVAAYASALGAVAKDEPDDPVVLHWVPLPEPRPATTTPLPDPAPHDRSVFPASAPLRVSIDVPNVLPSINLVVVAPVKPDFVRGTAGDAVPTDRSPTIGSGADGNRYYDASEVETAVTVIGNAVPDYPTALRSSGIEGSVAAEFVVTESGRADVRSLRIIFATNDGFAESIRRALPRMRFRAAKIGGREVPQLVRQNFVFRLDR